MGAIGSVSYMYENLCIVSFKGLSEEDTLNALILNDVDIIDIESIEDEIIVYGEPQNLFKIKDAITKALPNVNFDAEEITMLAKEKVELNKEDLEIFERLVAMFEEVEDVSHIYHNVANV